MKGLPEFDPAPFCNHAENVLDFRRRDYTPEFERMAVVLRCCLGSSNEVERELALRWILATRNSSIMAARFLRFHLRHSARLSEWYTVRNWLLRGVRQGRYGYGAESKTVMDESLTVQLDFRNDA